MSDPGTDAEIPFGQALRDELRAPGRGDVITGKLSYAGVQELKAADREKTPRMFRGSGYEVVQRIERDSPAELARFLIAAAQQTSRDAALAGEMGMMMGMAIQ